MESSEPNRVFLPVHEGKRNDSWEYEQNIYDSVNSRGLGPWVESSKDKPCDHPVVEEKGLHVFLRRSDKSAATGVSNHKFLSLLNLK